MKRSEMLLKIAKSLKDDWYAKNGEKLKGSTYYGYSIAEGYKQAEVMLKVCEESGMLPPGQLEVINEGLLYYYTNGEIKTDDSGWDIDFKKSKLWEKE